eukprot:TRINITY_DN5755_c0_g1_i1.p1 TRINITY_DN5755_c0_g1~~TRINITY_DN5755_c0_g1_i1.p1  ORF type:complete len:1564 (+),score=73.96 TRINITY_DN5755_c0_g1_i1:233-4924(+)
MRQDFIPWGPLGEAFHFRAISAPSGLLYAWVCQNLDAATNLLGFFFLRVDISSASAIQPPLWVCDFERSFTALPCAGKRLSPPTAQTHAYNADLHGIRQIDPSLHPIQASCWVDDAVDEGRTYRIVAFAVYRSQPGSDGSAPEGHASPPARRIVPLGVADVTVPVSIASLPRVSSSSGSNSSTNPETCLRLVPPIPVVFNSGGLAPSWRLPTYTLPQSLRSPPRRQSRLANSTAAEIASAEEAAGHAVSTFVSTGRALLPAAASSGDSHSYRMQWWALSQLRATGEVAGAVGCHDMSSGELTRGPAGTPTALEANITTAVSPDRGGRAAADAGLITPAADGVTSDGADGAESLSTPLFKDVTTGPGAVWASLGRGLDVALLRLIASAGAGDGLRCAFYEAHYLPVMLALSAAAKRGATVAVVVDGAPSGPRWVDKGKGWSSSAGGYDYANGKTAAAAGFVGAASVFWPGLQDPEEGRDTVGPLRPLVIPRRTSGIHHNKFCVLARNGSRDAQADALVAQGSTPSVLAPYLAAWDSCTPVALWTGSANISTSGLFGQLNCAQTIACPHCGRPMRCQRQDGPREKLSSHAVDDDSASRMPGYEDCTCSCVCGCGGICDCPACSDVATVIAAYWAHWRTLADPAGPTPAARHAASAAVSTLRVQSPPEVPTAPARGRSRSLASPWTWGLDAAQAVTALRESDGTPTKVPHHSPTRFGQGTAARPGPRTGDGGRSCAFRPTRSSAEATSASPARQSDPWNPSTPPRSVFGGDPSHPPASSEPGPRLHGSCGAGVKAEPLDDVDGFGDPSHAPQFGDPSTSATSGQGSAAAAADVPCEGLLQRARPSQQPAALPRPYIGCFFTPAPDEPFINGLAAAVRNAQSGVILTAPFGVHKTLLAALRERGPPDPAWIASVPLAAKAINPEQTSTMMPSRATGGEGAAAAAPAGGDVVWSNGGGYYHHPTCYAAKKIVAKQTGSVSDAEAKSKERHNCLPPVGGAVTTPPSRPSAAAPVGPSAGPPDSLAAASDSEGCIPRLVLVESSQHSARVDAESAWVSAGSAIPAAVCPTWSAHGRVVAGDTPGGDWSACHASAAGVADAMRSQSAQGGDVSGAARVAAFATGPEATSLAALGLSRWAAVAELLAGLGPLPAGSDESSPPPSADADVYQCPCRLTIFATGGEGPSGLGTHCQYMHAKVLIVDPFGRAPLVITGSNNISKNAFVNNDENTLVIAPRGLPAAMRPLAAHLPPSHFAEVPDGRSACESATGAPDTQSPADAVARLGLDAHRDAAQGCADPHWEESIVPEPAAEWAQRAVGISSGRRARGASRANASAAGSDLVSVCGVRHGSSGGCLSRGLAPCHACFVRMPAGELPSLLIGASDKAKPPSAGKVAGAPWSHAWDGTVDAYVVALVRAHMHHDRRTAVRSTFLSANYGQPLASTKGSQQPHEIAGTGRPVGSDSAVSANTSTSVEPYGFAPAMKDVSNSRWLPRDGAIRIASSVNEEVVAAAPMLEVFDGVLDSWRTASAAEVSRLRRPGGPLRLCSHDGWVDVYLAKNGPRNLAQMLMSDHS